MDLSHPLDELIGHNSARILHRLAVVSDPLTGRRIADISHVPVASAARVLAELEKIGLVSTRTVGSARTYELNRAHVLWDALERILAAPARVAEIAARSVTDVVGERATIALFGSFARGEAGPASDIDVLLIWDEAVPDDKRAAALDALNQNLALATGNRVEVVELEDADLKRMVQLGDPLIDSWRRDARSLAGPDIHTRLAAASG